MRVSQTYEWRYATVPAGKTGIVSCITLLNRGAATASVYMSIADYQVLYRTIPVRNDIQIAGQHWVLEEGEQVGVYSEGETGLVYVTVHGYLLEGTAHGHLVQSGEPPSPLEVPGRAMPA